MIRMILWKEWHENRSKYLSYWFTLNAPALLLILAIALTSVARVPFADLSDATVIKYLPLSLVQSVLSATIFLLLTGYLAVATFSPEIDDRSLFFIFEQPLPRRQYIGIKLLYGAVHVLLGTFCAILLLPAASYVLILLSGKATIAGSGAAFALVMAAASRTAVWCSLISVTIFAASTLVAALVPRWWLAAACSVVVTVLLAGASGDYFNFIPDDTGDPISVGMNVSTGNAQWVTISRALKPVELQAIGVWRPLPLLIALLVTLALCAATIAIYNHKEMK